MSRTRRTTLTAVLSIGLLILSASAVLADGPDHEDPAAAAAAWLGSQLVDGERIVNVEFAFDDAGLTADVVFALASAGLGADTAATATAWLRTQAGSYTGPDLDAVFAGATAKLALVAVVMGEDPTAFGGLDLIAQLEAREQPDGRFTDESAFGDFSSTLTQALAVLALTRSPGVTPSDEAVSFLLAQQCPDGGFRSDLDASDCVGFVDSTGFAVQALASLGDRSAEISAAAGWLSATQAADGSFASGEGANANSTGLAALALALAGEDTAADAARDWLRGLQDGCADDEPGAIRFDPADGGDPDRATAQAIPGLTGRGLDTITIAGAGAELPVVCPAATEDDPTQDDPTPEPEDVDEDAAEQPAGTGDDTGTSAEQLPETGSDPLAVAALGLLALLTGAALLARTRPATSPPGPTRR